MRLDFREQNVLHKKYNIYSKIQYNIVREHKYSRIVNKLYKTLFLVRYATFFYLKYNKGIIMPFAGFKNWDDCIQHYVNKNKTTEQAKRLCGAIKKKTEGVYKDSDTKSKTKDKDKKESKDEKE